MLSYHESKSELRKQYQREYQRIWRLNNVERVKSIQQKYRDTHRQTLREREKQHSELFPHLRKDAKRRRRESIRSDLFHILGGTKCIRCGFSDIRALEFDHINGHGSNDLLTLKRLMFYHHNPDLARHTLQVLCANCNRIKKHIKGEQPFIAYVK